MTRRIFLSLLLVFAVGASAAAQSKPTVVILVRHAEKGTVPANDPPLTEAGMARAKALAAALGGPKLPDICDSQYSNFYVLILEAGGKKADLVFSSYGAPSPDPATTCPNSMK